MVKEYTGRWNNFQFRSPSYVDGHFEPYKFDLVKWVQREQPIKVTDLITGEKKMSSEYCFSIGALTWDKKERGFDFESYGLRFLEENQDGLSEWIIAFAKMKELELLYEDETGTF